MGKIDGKYIIGLVGPVIQRKTKHGVVVQAAPRQMKQSKATKKAQGLFGQASRLARVIRGNLVSVTQENWDGDMVNRFNEPVRDVLKQCYNKETETYTFQENSFERLTGFEFNVKSLLINYLLVKPEMTLVGNTFKVTIPEISIEEMLRFPGSTNTCEFRIAFSSVALHAARTRQPEFRSFDVQIDQGIVPRQEFEFVTDAGCLCVAGIGLNYFRLSNGIRTEYNMKAFNPANVIGAVVVPGVFIMPPSYGSPWSTIDKLKLPAAEE